MNKRVGHSGLPAPTFFAYGAKYVQENLLRRKANLAGGLSGEVMAARDCQINGKVNDCGECVSKIQVNPSPQFATEFATALYLWATFAIRLRFGQRHKSFIGNG